MNVLDVIKETAARYQLPPALVRAIVAVESGGNLWAVRYEPDFFLRYVAGRDHRVYAPCSRVTEERLRACSFGPMQIMGQTARELGFQGVYLTELCAPAVGVEWGCRLLASLLVREKKRVDRAVAAYNAGSARLTPSGKFVNQQYVDKIRAAGGFA